MWKQLPGGCKDRAGAPAVEKCFGARICLVWKDKFKSGEGKDVLISSRWAQSSGKGDEERWWQGRRAGTWQKLQRAIWAKTALTILKSVVQSLPQGPQQSPWVLLQGRSPPGSFSPVLCSWDGNCIKGSPAPFFLPIRASQTPATQHKFLPGAVVPAAFKAPHGPDAMSRSPH